jgi:hypothetical protein
MKSLVWTPAFTKNICYNQHGGTTPLTLAKDLRHVGVENVKDVDAVVHRAELSNDLAGQLAPTITTKSTTRDRYIAELVLKAGLCKRRRNTLRFSYWETRLLECATLLARIHRWPMPFAK